MIISLPIESSSLIKHIVGEKSGSILDTEGRKYKMFWITFSIYYRRKQKLAVIII